MKPAARIGDMHVCPMVTPGTPPIPHVGGPVSIGEPTVLIGMMPAARMGDMCVCVGPPDAIAMGSPTVLIGMKLAARMGDPTVHGGMISVGCPTVLIGESGGGGAAVLQAVVDAVNPLGGTVNCGNIIDAAIDRLTGEDRNATAPVARDGSWAQIDARHNTTVQWGQSFDDAFAAVQDSGDGAIAIVGIDYGPGGGSHVVVMANQGGTVGIIEGQNWGTGNPPEVITDSARANTRYNSGGTTTVGVGMVREGFANNP